MSLKQPTSREYLILGVINVGVALYLATRGSWTAAYFVVIAIGAFWCALRARPGS
jgi:type IV secretory pathway VirB2 component (pilin)